MPPSWSAQGSSQALKTSYSCSPLRSLLTSQTRSSNVSIGSVRSAAGNNGSRSSNRGGLETTYGSLLVNKLVTGSRGAHIDMELFGPSPHDCRRLTARLKQAKTWREVSVLFPLTDDEWTGVDTICLSAGFSALSRVAGRAKGQSGTTTLKSIDQDISRALGTLVHLARPRLSEFDAQGLVTVAVSMAKLQEFYTPTPSKPLTTTPISSSLMSTSSHNTVISASSIPATQSTSQLQPLSQNVPNVFDMFEELLHCSTFLMPNFTPQSLANLIWALATLGLQPTGAWLTEYYRRLDEQVDVLKSQDVANIMWSLCKLDLMPDIWLRDSLVERSLDAVREQKGTSGQDPATLIQCLARWYFMYNYRVSDDWLCEYLQIVQPCLGTYLPFDLVSIVHSCVVMNHQPTRSWMTDYYAHIMHSLKYDPTLSYSDFQRLMWALSRVDYTPPLIWQREFVTVSIPKLTHLKIRALSELVWALACWDCRPSPEWLAAFFNASGPRLSDARPHHISCTLSALSKLEVRAPGHWMDQALKSFCTQLADAKAHDLVTLLDTITVVCNDPAWLQGHTGTIKSLADTAASKFAVYDAVMHTKLCVALAAANVCPAADWLKKQQGALVACLRGGDADSQTAAQSLREVYRTWDVEVDAELQPFL